LCEWKQLPQHPFNGHGILNKIIRDDYNMLLCSHYIYQIVSRRFFPLKGYADSLLIQDRINANITSICDSHIAP